MGIFEKGWEKPSPIQEASIGVASRIEANYLSVKINGVDEIMHKSERKLTKKRYKENTKTKGQIIRILLRD
ncbi:hypothetical protein NECAME_16578 [Necator americanus]|uniref:RNA helicase n=1 Tax=Necator americanus TaxID=51031 RepID=W2TVT0_NECAM|nr:hypothetical protein NECAME_16578 [Necator americanus]ETN85923.1 hypothetical protein NECAME_16578 [Necator americanus]